RRNHFCTVLLQHGRQQLSSIELVIDDHHGEPRKFFCPYRCCLMFDFELWCIRRVCLQLRRENRERHRKCCAETTALALSADRSAVQLDQMSHYRKSEPQTAVRTSECTVGLT